MTEDLFAHAGARDQAAAMPLAARMRPRSLDAFSGHADLVGPGAPLRMALERDEMWSVVLWGSPGTGKTSLARIAAAMTERRFVELSAVSATVRDVRGVIAQAASERDMYRKRTLVFLDEIHRFNKAQQDVLLPAVEDGVIALWGATTENPYFELNAPLLSRMRVLRLQPLEAEDLRAIVERALDSADGLGADAPGFAAEAVEQAVAASGGDARVALNWIESAAAFARERGLDRVTADVATEAALTRQVRYDRAADEHYDTISAYIKSVRGSDPDAALFWLAKMLEGGEAPEFIARRIVILASEDIGNADPQALPLAWRRPARWNGWGCRKRAMRWRRRRSTWRRRQKATRRAGRWGRRNRRFVGAQTWRCRCTCGGRRIRGWRRRMGRAWGTGTRMTTRGTGWRRRTCRGSRGFTTGGVAVRKGSCGGEAKSAAPDHLQPVVTRIGPSARARDG